MMSGRSKYDSHRESSQGVLVILEKHANPCRSVSRDVTFRIRYRQEQLGQFGTGHSEEMLRPCDHPE